MRKSNTAGRRGGVDTPSRRTTNKLSDRALRSLRDATSHPRKGPRKLADGAGLYAMRTPAGSVVWRLKYRLAGKEKVYAIGTYPAISLDAARKERDRVKAQIRERKNPTEERQLTRASAVSSSASTFAGATADWLEKKKKDWSRIHFTKSSQALERDVLPSLGKFPVSKITPAMVASVIEKVVARGAGETASKILWNVICVFRFAQARGLCLENPAIPVREVLPKRKQHTQRPALLEFPALGELMRRAELAPLSPPVRMAHRLIAFTAARIGNAIDAQWKEFELEGDTPAWVLPRSRMKVRERGHDHRVLLGPTITAELRRWHSITGGRGYLFPSPMGNSHITRESLEKAYRVTLKMEGRHSIHGWRASFSTLARDAGFSRDVVELTLDHVHDNAVARAYDRGERMAERIRLMYWWDAQLTGAQHSGRAIPLRAGAA